jgi:hypothetical protein
MKLRDDPAWSSEIAWKTICAASRGKRQEKLYGRHGEKQRFLGQWWPKRSSSSRRAASFLRKFQLKPCYPKTTGSLRSSRDDAPTGEPYSSFGSQADLGASLMLVEEPAY